MRQYQFIPLDKRGNVIAIGVGGLLNFDVLTELEKSSSSHIQVYVSTWSEIKAAIEDHFKTSSKKPGEETDTALAEMELIAGGAGEEVPGADEAPEAPEAAEAAQPEPAVAPAAAAAPAETAPAEAAPGGGEQSDDLTELGNLLLGDMDVGEGGSGGGS
jgi:hypothetical protein